MTLMTVKITELVTVTVTALEVTGAAPFTKASMSVVAVEPWLRAYIVSVVGEAGTVTKIVETGLHADSFLGFQDQCHFLAGTSHKARSLVSETEL